MKINEFKTPSMKPTVLKREEKFVKGKLDKIILTLKDGPDALIAQFVKIKNLVDDLEKEKSALNKEVKENISALFTAEEKIITRVIKTADFSATLSSEYKSGDTNIVEYEQLMNELVTKVTPDVVALVEELKAKYTRINEGQQIVSRLLIKPAKESMTEAMSMKFLKEQSVLSRVLDWIKSFSRHALESFIPKLHDYDLKLERLIVKANLKNEHF